MTWCDPLDRTREGMMAAWETPQSAQRELDLLCHEIKLARSELSALRNDIALARSDAGVAAWKQLLKENERLNVANSRASADVDTANAALEKAVRASELDWLTGLPNRLLLLERLAHDMAIAKRHATRLALLFLDLNGFKTINDTYGHAVGDIVLQHVSATLNASVRASDTVSRHGGDEFLVVLSEVNQPSDAAIMVDKIAKALSVPFDAGGIMLHLTASIGFSLYPDHSATPDGLIQMADGAMYLAKRARRPNGGLKPSVA